jgi:GNAT superfamily N-acetyltransferase
MSDEEVFSAPERITADHDLTGFSCASPSLDEWLGKRALRNEATGASRTFVVCFGKRVVGYYALANGAVSNEHAPGRVRRNMPDPVPVMVIGRLAADRSVQRRGLGRALLRDAVLRTLQASKIAGIRAILVHAISDDARRFYERCGFAASPVDPMTLMLTVEDAVNNLVTG